MTNNPYNLQRFVDAQNPVYDQVCRELRSGQKRTHWMWFIFPQLKGLGHSTVANLFGIASLAEAQAYLEHSILGRRLQECTQLVTEIEAKSVEQIFGYPDDLKFRSSMTLFSHATVSNSIFKRALDKYFEGLPDSATLQKLGLERQV